MLAVDPLPNSDEELHSPIWPEWVVFALQSMIINCLTRTAEFTVSQPFQTGMSMEGEEFGSDTDDEDYTPEDGPAASEEENSGEEEAAPAAEGGGVVETKKVRRKKPVKATGRGGMFEEGGDRIDWGAEQEKERKEVSEEAEKKKTEDIWADFKKDTGGSSAKAKSSGSGLGSLASLGAPSAKAPQAKPTSRFGSIFDSVEKEKKPEDDMVGEAVKEKPKSRFSSLFDTSTSSKAEGESEEPSKAATAPGDKVEITKVFDFAGEVVKVSKQVAADSKEAAKFLAAGTTSTSTTKRPGGLAGVVGGMSKVRGWSR